MAHLGRPEGWDEKLTLAPVAKYLAKLLRKRVNFIADDITKKDISKKIAKGVNMLENVRFYEAESAGDSSFAKRLAGLGDIYVNEGFSVSHRADASVAGLQNFLPSYAGIFLEREIENLSRCLRVGWRSRPYVALMGGAKISTKINLILNLLKSADNVLLGGALISGLLKFQGYKIGKTLTEEIAPMVAKGILRNKKVVMPKDVVVGQADNAKNLKTVRLADTKELCKKDESILDMGPETVLEFSKYIKKARTIVWNGPLGLFERPPLAYATIALAQLIATRSKGRAFAAVGGGETIVALKLTQMEEYVDWVSTGGGAMLSFLAGEKMPGLRKIIS
jgi:3-phosphoglycerate kinase